MDGPLHKFIPCAFFRIKTRALGRNFHFILMSIPAQWSSSFSFSLLSLSVKLPYLNEAIKEFLDSLSLHKYIGINYWRVIRWPQAWKYRSLSLYSPVKFSFIKSYIVSINRFFQIILWTQILDFCRTNWRINGFHRWAFRHFPPIHFPCLDFTWLINYD